MAKARGKYLRSPVVILVGSAWQPEAMRRREDRDAVAAAVQTLLLGATASGLASHWATGDWMDDAAVKELAGLAPDDDLVALVYLGWPNGEVPAVERPAPIVAWFGVLARASSHDRVDRREHADAILDRLRGVEAGVLPEPAPHHLHAERQAVGGTRGHADHG